MKARELIIGDLVRIIEPDRFHGAICRIVSLIDHKDDECAYFQVFVLTKGHLMHEVCNEDIEPIPLTSAILEKNGWKETQFCHEYKDEENILQSCLPDMRGIINGVEIQHFNCEYVHQYQHLLSLCGQNELADNLKI